MTNGNAGTTTGIPWDGLHKLLTAILAIATAVLGVWQFQLQHKLDVEQARLKQKVEKTKLVDLMLTRIEDYLEKLPPPGEGDGSDGKKGGLTAAEKTRILISLLKIATEVHLEQTGQLENEEQKNLVRAIPLHFALLSENHEMLVTIGSKPEDLPLWIPFARATADPVVKETAAKALGRIAALTTDGNVHANIINSLLELTIDWKDPELSESVAVALGDVLDRIDDEDLQDIPELAEAVRQAKAKFDLLKLAHAPAPAPENDRGEPEVVKTVQPEYIQQVSQVFNEVQVLPESELQIDDLIGKLESTDKSVRRSTRSTLGSVGTKAVPDLLQALETQGSEYRIRLGVITAFLLMEQPIAIPDDKIHLIANLLGDPDATIRKNTAKLLVTYLQSLGDRADAESDRTIGVTLDALFNSLMKLENDNAVYNSVAVLGEVWRQEMPERLKMAIREQLLKAKEAMTKDRRSWRKTIALIDVYLK